MTGIVSYGGHVPALRIERNVIAEAWGRKAIKGERSVANNDEDSITMAVEAALNCINSKERQDIEGLFFASTTAPYQEKMNSALISTATDLKRKIVTCDFSNSLRSGTAALRAGLDSVKSGSTRNLLVTSADQRLCYPKSDGEQIFGDGSASVLIGRENLVATYEGSCSITNEMMDVWRNPEDRYVKMWEGRFVLGEGYAAHIKEIIGAILDKYNLTPRDITKLILPATDGRICKKLAKDLGFDENVQVQDTLLSDIGHCGTAQPLMMLCAALEEAEPGDLILLTAYGDGADAFLFKTTEKVTEKVNRFSMKTMIENKLMLSQYGRFLSYKNILEPQPGEPFRLLPSATVSWRERNSSLRCYGSKCRKCGHTTFPIQRVCYHCRSKDEFDEVRISDRGGMVFTFTRDNIAGRSDDPVVIQTVADIDGGVRFYGLMTDCDPSKVELKMQVDMTFRRFYDGAGFHNYFWKLRPIRKQGE